MNLNDLPATADATDAAADTAPTTASTAATSGKKVYIKTYGC